jgi:hypothetical protein
MKPRTLALTPALLAGVLLGTGPALADPPAGKGKDKGATDAPSAAAYAPGQSGEHGRPAFSSKERGEIERYFRANPDARKQLPPGLAKKNKLPPGWQKKLEPGQRVPDDVWARRVALPREIKLPEEKGVIRVRIDDRVVKVAERTREVLDVLNLPPP